MQISLTPRVGNGHSNDRGRERQRGGPNESLRDHGNTQAGNDHAARSIEALYLNPDIQLDMVACREFHQGGMDAIPGMQTDERLIQDIADMNSGDSGHPMPSRQQQDKTILSVRQYRHFLGEGIHADHPYLGLTSHNSPDDFRAVRLRKSHPRFGVNLRETSKVVGQKAIDCTGIGQQPYLPARVAGMESHIGLKFAKVPQQLPGVAHHRMPGRRGHQPADMAGK